MLDRRHLPYLALLVAFLCAFLWGLSQGMLGHDYFYFFPKLLDGKWHFLRQGMSLFAYTPHFCGGFPEYANPQSMYYSLQQVLVLFLDLWLAMQITIITSMLIGYIGWYRFGRDLVRLSLPWAHVLALIITAHGFHFMHMIPGHIVFHSMPIIGWLLWMLFDRRNLSRTQLIHKAAWFALATGYILYSGGYMVVVMTAFAVLAFLPFEILLRPSIGKRVQTLLRNAITCGIGALLIAGSTLVATFSFLEHFPREMPFERFADGASVLLFLTRALFFLPQHNDLFWEFGMPEWGAIHEYSFLISPVVLVGLLCGIGLLVTRHRTLLQRPVRTALIVLAFLVLHTFLLQLMRGHGWLVTPLETLPVFSGLHVNMRWLYAFSFPLISLSVWCLAEALPERLQRYSLPLSITCSIMTIGAFLFGYAGLLQTESLPRTMPYNVILEALEEQEGYMEKDVEEAFDMRGLGHSGFIPLIFAGNHIYCSEPMLLGSSTLPDTITVAPVMQEIDGVLNMYNPACMVYPEENDCQPGDRIALEDAENLERFRRGQKTTWKVSLSQTIAHWVSLLTLFGSLFIVGLSLWRREGKRTPE